MVVGVGGGGRVVRCTESSSSAFADESTFSGIEGSGLRRLPEPCARGEKGGLWPVYVEPVNFAE